MNENTEKLKLLIVDDEEEFLESSARALSRRGFEVHTADDGASGLALVSRTDFDAVVLDLKMPGIDGEEVFDRIHSTHPSVPVIMLTGHGSVPHAFKTSKKGIADYVAKPCDMDDLAGRIRRAVGAAKSRGGVIPGEPGADLASVVDVLLVGDEPELISALMNSLRRRGMNVSAAETEEKALGRLKANPFDVVVADVSRADAERLDFLKKTSEIAPHVKVILMSGNPSARAALSAVRSGASEYLSKPPDVENLIALIRRLYRRKRDDMAKERKRLIEEIRSRYPD
jgi:DNA-binding NtrC family response regulator